MASDSVSRGSEGTREPSREPTFPKLGALMLSPVIPLGCPRSNGHFQLPIPASPVQAP